MRRSVLLLLLPALTVAATVPKVKAKVSEIDIRDTDGKVLLAADDLMIYDCATHTLTLKHGAKVGYCR